MFVVLVAECQFMRPIPLLALAALAFTSPAMAQTYQAEFNVARALEKSDPQASAYGMIQSFEHALAAGDHEYTSVAGLNACGIIYRQGKTVEAGKLARRVITALAPLHDDYPDSAAVRRVQFFGYIERGLLAEGKIGAAWQANRGAAETLRGEIVAADADGPAITLAGIRGLQPELRSYGFRVIEREADLLDIAGRSNEALTLLNEAAEFFGNDWQQRFNSFEQFYVFKLLASRAELLDFLGEKEKAIELGTELATAVKPTSNNNRQSLLTLRINLLRNRSQWDGPSEEFLREAREIASEMKREKIDNNVDRLVAKMEFDLKESREPLDAIRRNLLKNQDLGDAYEATYAGRDSLLARAQLGDPNLDSEFQAILKTLRSHGNKRGEPTLYRAYGVYLLQQKRPADAITLLAESLRMTRGFGWVLHEPGLLGSLVDARIAAGDPAGARATLAEFDAWITTHTDAPAARRATAVTARAEALAKLGDDTGAHAAFQLARKIAKDLPEYQRSALTAEAEERAIAQGRQPVAVAAASAAPLLSVQPLEIVGMAVPGAAARTRFSVFNPTAQSLQGRFVFTGPAAVVSPGGGVTFTAGGTAVTEGMPKILSAGGEAQVEVSVAAAKGVDAAAIQVAWENAGQKPGPTATWEVSWSPDASRSVVLDASCLEANPFRSVSLFHELAVPIGEAIGIPFRLRSTVPLRFEYFDAASHQLLAIDANGNGDFTEAGDLHIRGPKGVSAAIFPVAPAGKSVTAEIRIFATDGLPLFTTGSTLVLEAEVHRNGSWTKEAEDTLK